MLGITVADAVAIVGVALTVLAAWRGARAGETAANTIKPSSVVAGVAGALLTSEMMDRLIDALEAISEAIRAGHERKDREHVDKLNERIERLMAQLDRKT